MGLTGKSRQRQFSSRAEAARLHPYSSSKTVGDSLPSGCFPHVASLENVWRLTVRSAKRYIDSVTFTNARDDALERGRLCVVIATIVINVIAVSLLTFAPWSDWRTGVALNVVDNCLLVGFTVVRRDALLARFLLFGVVVGLTELAADAWLVDYTRTLDYSIGGGPMIWRSPLWMPLAWEVVAVQFGYIGLRLWERFGKTGLLMIGLLGAINIPFYEEMARRIHWWQYSGCRMISYTPWYIILGEFGIARGFRVAGANAAARFMARRVCFWRRWRSVNFCLLCCRLSDYRSIN